MMVIQMDYLHILENAYLALLKTPIVYRLEIQNELCELRDTIAEITGEDIEAIQNKFEAATLNEIINKLPNGITEKNNNNWA